MSLSKTDVRTAARANRLDRLAVRGRPILACYFLLGDPAFDDRMREIYAEEGVDIFELGIPSANPFMDGPDVAGAMQRALAAGRDPYARLADMTGWLSRQEDGPASVCMAYADGDPDRIAAAGPDGALIIAPRDRPVTIAGSRTCGLLRLSAVKDDIVEAAGWDGYVMVQAADGVTGPREHLDPRLGDSIAAARAAGLLHLMLAGFGIGTAEQAQGAIAAGADGVIIGSMCVRKVMQGPNEIRHFLRDVRSTIDG